MKQWCNKVLQAELKQASSLLNMVTLNTWTRCNQVLQSTEIRPNLILLNMVTAETRMPCNQVLQPKGLATKVLQPIEMGPNLISAKHGDSRNMDAMQLGLATKQNGTKPHRW